VTELTRGAYALPGTTLAFRTGTWRVQKPVHHYRPAPCGGACPAGEDAQAWLALLAQGRARQAWEKLVEANPLPAISGRVCHHPCESACNRGQYDEAVGIHGVERFLGDAAIRHGWAYPVAPPAADARPVAVVGAGPAGLSAAFHLLRRGHRVSLFDSLPAAGGTCRMAIPPYRLPRDVLDAEVERVLAAGIDFRGQHRLGRDVSLAELRQDYGAVFLAPGTQRHREWSIDGAVPRDLHVGLDLLKAWMTVGSMIQADSVAIIGGGNTAVDVARVLRRCRVPAVHIITHESLPGEGIAPADAMRAIPREIAQAQEEGVIIHPHRGILRLILRGERVVGVEMAHMKKLPRADGSVRLVPFEGTETVLHVDQVIPAIGQQVDASGMDELLLQQPFFAPDALGALPGHSGVYVGGDARPGRGTVSAAVGDGRRAAAAIDYFLRGQPAPEDAAAAAIGFAQLNLNYFERTARAEAPILPPERRTGQDEIEGGLDANQANHEAGRCLSCGNCLACDNCWTLCPDSAVLKTTQRAADGSHYVFDYDYCKGCGLCAHECPCGYIAMVDEA
jgi:NADPH-dependent glutamate synthase beta subunit-like oxidoreductase